MKFLKPKSEFSRNVLTLMTGAAIAQAIPIAISPILTRIYTPEDFGKYALFLSLVMMATSIISLRYEQAIVLPQKNKNAIALLQGSFYILIVMSVILTSILIYLKELINFDSLLIGYFFISVLFFGSVNIIVAYFNRIKKYNLISLNITIMSLSNAFLSLIFGLFSASHILLILSILLSKIISFISLYRYFIRYIKIKIKPFEILNELQYYKDMPKHSTPEVFIGTINQHAIILFLTYFFEPVLAGYYFLIQRILGTPISIFSSSFSKVFYKEFTVSSYKKNFILKIWFKLFILILPFWFILYFTIDDIVTYVFGANWSEAALIAKLLLPYFAINFIFSATGTSHLTLRLQHIALIFALVSLLIKCIIFIYGYLNNDYIFTIKLLVYYDICQIILMNIFVYNKIR